MEMVQLKFIELVLLQSFPTFSVGWNEILFLIGGGGLVKLTDYILFHRRQRTDQSNDVQQILRDELRGEIDDLRVRLQKTEEDHIALRKRHFNLQENYYQLRREYQEALTDLRNLKEELKEYKNSN